MKTNYHTHSHFCDGKGDPRSYVLSAISKGFSSLGFSSHAPLIFKSDWTLDDSQVGEYIDCIRRLKVEFKDEIDIYLGMEIDYFPGENRVEYFKNFDLDYSIGAVHLLYCKEKDDYFSVDSSPKDFVDVMENTFGSIESFGQCYYKNLRELIKLGGFNILAHFDLIKKYNRNNRFFNEKDKWYIDEVVKTLDLLATTDIIVEVNTGAIARKVQDLPYPSKWILEECYSRGIKICLNSDCHSAKMIECFYDEALEIIKSVGYTELHTPFEIIKI